MVSVTRRGVRLLTHYSKFDVARRALTVLFNFANGGPRRERDLTAYGISQAVAKQA